MRGYPSRYYPRKKNGAKWLLVLVIVAVLIFYANSKGIIHLNLPSFGNFTFFGNQSSSVNACHQKVNSCGEIIDLKYGSNMSLLKESQFQNPEDANQFLSTWKSSSQSGDISSYNISSYPVVLIAARFDNADNSKSPYVFICKSDGNFAEKNTEGLC